MTSGHTLRQLDSEMARVRERLNIYEHEAQSVARESAERRQLIAGQQQELEAHEERRGQLETQMKLGQDELERLREARDQAAQAASQAMALVATLEERRRAAAASLARIQSMAGEVNRRIHSLRAQLEAAAAEQKQRAAENERIALQLLEWTAERERINCSPRASCGSAIS